MGNYYKRGFLPHMGNSFIIIIIIIITIAIPLYIKFIYRGLDALIGPLRLYPTEQYQLFKIFIPWAISTNRSCLPLISIYYEKYYSMDIDEFRNKIGFKKMPQLI